MAKARQENDARPRSPYALLGLGFEIAVPIVLLFLIGYKLDAWLDTAPWITLVGAFLGLAVAFYNLFRRVAASSGEGRPR